MMQSQHSKRSALAALLLIVPAPVIAVFMAMMLDGTRGTSLGVGIYAGSKIWILLLPLLWLLFVDRASVSLSPARQGGLLVGVGLGAVIAVAIGAAYLLAGDMIDVNQMREAAVRNGIGTPVRYLVLVIPLALVNSLLEEYVWRWFVYSKCEQLMKPNAAVFGSALLFALHHLVALRAQTSWDVAVLATLGVFIGGCIWSWCYRRYRSIWPGYISHVIADVAVFAVGWMVLFGGS